MCGYGLTQTSSNIVGLSCILGLKGAKQGHLLNKRAALRSNLRPQATRRLFVTNRLAAL